MNRIKIFIDGASRGNPGSAGIGILIISEDNKVLKEYKEFLGGNYTNNEAEYLALLKALELVKALGNETVFVFSDSELLVQQVKGKYQVRKEHLQKLFTKVKTLEKAFKTITYQHIAREENELADKLANAAIDEALG
jgi:ribonuclease HI